MGSSREIAGKRKFRDYKDGREEELKKGCMKGGRNYKVSGVVTRDEKNGSRLAEAAKQSRRPQ